MHKKVFAFRSGWRGEGVKMLYNFLQEHQKGLDMRCMVFRIIKKKKLSILIRIDPQWYHNLIKNL